MRTVDPRTGSCAARRRQRRRVTVTTACLVVPARTSTRSGAPSYVVYVSPSSARIRAPGAEVPAARAICAASVPVTRWERIRVPSASSRSRCRGRGRGRGTGVADHPSVECLRVFDLFPIAPSAPIGAGRPFGHQALDPLRPEHFDLQGRAQGADQFDEERAPDLVAASAHVAVVRVRQEIEDGSARVPRFLNVGKPEPACPLMAEPIPRAGSGEAGGIYFPSVRRPSN